MTPTNGELVERVRQAFTSAHQAGQPKPGRPTLVRLTGATDHAVRRALAELAAEQVNAGELEVVRPDRAPSERMGTGESASQRRQASAGPAAPPGGRLVRGPASSSAR